MRWEYLWWSGLLSGNGVDAYFKWSGRIVLVLGELKPLHCEIPEVAIKQCAIVLIHGPRIKYFVFLRQWHVDEYLLENAGLAAGLAANALLTCIYFLLLRFALTRWAKYRMAVLGIHYKLACGLYDCTMIYSMYCSAFLFMLHICDLNICFKFGCLDLVSLAKEIINQG